MTDVTSQKEELINKNGYEFNVYPEHDTNFWNQYKNNSWETYTFKIFDKFLNKENAYFDIGAWVGPTVLYGANLASAVYGFEPDIAAFNLLNSNIELNPKLKDKIKVFNYGVAGENKQAIFYVGEGMTSMSSVIENKNNSGNSYQANFKAIQTIVDEINIDFNNVNFIKIDIEGGEYELIPSLLNYFKEKNHFPTLYISLHDGGSREILVKQVNSEYKYLYDCNFVPIYKDELIPNEIIVTNINGANKRATFKKAFLNFISKVSPFYIKGLDKNSDKIVISIFWIKITHRKKRGQ